MYNEFEAWLDAALEADLPEDIAAFNFNLYEDGDNLWSIELIGASRFDPEDPDWACEEIFTNREDPLSWRAEVDWQEVQETMTQYVEKYLADIVAEAKKNGFVTTLLGRRRYIPELASKKKMEVAFGERVAMNSPIQGSAADIIKLAMVNADAKLRESGYDARLIMQVHDELIIEAHESCAEEVKALLVREMEGALALPVRLAAEVGVGKTWFDAH
jgi:DNA polymerase I-like protein with 3'-5' exonuclease and polymerase domains